MKAIAVIGPSGSGKTTVCEVIIRGLSQKGYRVGSVKEIHCRDFTLDPDPSANTRRHRAAGSQLVTARATAETDLLYPGKLPVADILRHYDQDYVVLEGVADGNFPSIVTAHRPEEARERMDDLTVAVSGVLANTHTGQLFGLPIINALKDPETLVDLAEKRAFTPLPAFAPGCCSMCGGSCRELAGKIAGGKAKREDCLLFSQKTELLVNGVPVSMVPFVQSILRNAVLGVIRELKGFPQQGKIEVKFHT